MDYEKLIDYVVRSDIKLWNLYNDNIITYFKKRFSKYLTEIGLSWEPFIHPKSNIQVINLQTDEAQFHIYLFDDEHNDIGEIEEPFLNMDLIHLLFFDINDKEQELKVLDQFNEIV